MPDSFIASSTPALLQAAINKYTPGQWSIISAIPSADKTSMVVTADYCGATVTNPDTWTQALDDGTIISYTQTDQGPSLPGTTCTPAASGGGGTSSGATAAVVVLGVGALGVLGWMFLK